MQRGSKSAAQVRDDYRRSFDQELQQLRSAIAHDDHKAQREHIHKLIGLCNLQNNPAISEAVGALSAQSKQHAPAQRLIAQADQLSQLVRDSLFQDKG